MLEMKDSDMMRDFMIQTDRLNIYAATREEMEMFVAGQQISELKAAYTEMLEGCLNHPEQWAWYVIWMIEGKDGTHIGELSFKGITAHGVVEIGYGVLPEHEGQGFATEAVSAAARWALAQPGVAQVEAETESSNIASQRVLQKSGFVATGALGEEGPRYAFTGG